MEEVSTHAAYVPPEVTLVGSVADLTQAHLLSSGSDYLSGIPVIGGFFGS